MLVVVLAVGAFIAITLLAGVIGVAAIRAGTSLPGARWFVANPGWDFALLLAVAGVVVVLVRAG